MPSFLKKAAKFVAQKRVVMQITLEILNPRKQDFLLNLLREFDYVKILRPVSSKPQPLESPILPDESEVDFLEFWGVTQPQMGIEAIDKQIAEMRED